MLSLTGCMRIYPDSELPDVKVVWGEQDCRATPHTVRLILTGVDDPASGVTTTVPCTDLGVTFANVARERFQVAGALIDPDGSVFSKSEMEVDLRNGFDQQLNLYFEGLSNLRVAWAFAGGATCASLGATSVAMVFSTPEVPDIERYEFPCEALQFSGSVAPGNYTAKLRALATDQVVAVSPVTMPFAVTAQTLTDLGLITLAPAM